MFSKCARACVDGHVRGSRSADDLIQLPQFGKVASMAWSRDCSFSVRRFVDAESHVASRRLASVWLCKSYAGARAAAQMPMHSLVQPNTDTEDLSDAFLSCATRGWRHRGVVQVGDWTLERTKYFHDSSVNTTQHFYDTTWTRLVRVPRLSKPARAILKANNNDSDAAAPGPATL